MSHFNSQTVFLCAYQLELFVYQCTVVCTTTDLVEIRVGLRFSHSIEVLHIN